MFEEESLSLREKDSQARFSHFLKFEFSIEQPDPKQDHVQPGSPNP
jgi:hypothetical protein